MTPFIPLFPFSVLYFVLTALGQQISLDTPFAVQCAETPIHWTGGVSPFTLTISTTDDANISSVEYTPVVDSSPYSWVADLPGETPFQIFLEDENGLTAQTETTIQNSGNSSCLDQADVVPPSSHTGHGSRTGTTPSSTSSASTGTPSSQSSSSGSSSHMAVIVGAVIGVLVLLALIVVLMVLQKRRDRRHHMSSKEELVRTFGSAKANLDGFGEDDADEMAIPDPYVYGTVSRAQATNLAPLETGDLRHNATATRRSPGATSNTSNTSRSPSTPASRKGERYLPDYTTTPKDGSSGSRIQEDDIDRLAARMVAMMAAGRVADQTWAPGPGGPRDRGLDLDDELPAPPPLYKDVARRSGHHPSGGR